MYAETGEYPSCGRGKGGRAWDGQFPIYFYHCIGMRSRIVAGNWKMHKSLPEAESTVSEIADDLKDDGPQVFLALPFPFIQAITSRFGNTSLVFGAQNINEHDEGAYTGEVSGIMLRSVGCRFVLVGHSERRQYYKEDDTQIHLKILAALRHFLRPVLCCGERLEERQAGQHFSVVSRQLSEALYALNHDAMQEVIIAYEPVWAIGTGVNASPGEAQEMHAFIRDCIRKQFGEATADNLSILYGGSVKPSNAASLFAEADLDGGLVGGASLHASDFLEIIGACK